MFLIPICFCSTKVTNYIQKLQLFHLLLCFYVNSLKLFNMRIFYVQNREENN